MATNLLDLMGYMQDQGDRGRALGQQSKLAQLASQAYGAPQDQRQGLVQQAIGVDPQSGFALGQNLQGDEDARMKRVGQMAGMLVNLPSQARPQAYAGIVRELQGIGLGEGLPDQWSDDLMPYAQQLAGQLGGGSNVQSTFVDAQGNRVAIMRDGSTQVLGQNAPNNQIIDTGDGYFGVNKGSLQAAPVTVGQPPMAPGEVPFAIDPNLPPEIQAAIRANPDAGSAGGIQSFGGEQLRSAPEQMTPYQQAQLETMGVPAGYQRTPAGLEPIPGGPADPNAPRPLSPTQVAAQQKAQRTQRKEQQMLAANEAAVDQTVKLIDDILARRDDLSGVTGLGRVGAMIPGTDWADLAAKLDTLKGRSAFGALQQMRANSPTGGALGQVSERELYLLQNAETQLQDSQSPEALASALQDYRAALLASKRRMREGVSEFYSEQPASAPQDGGVDDLLSKYGVK